MTEELIYRREGPLAFVTFNRPQARNAMTWAMYERLTEVCDEAASDEAVRVVVFQGAGDKAFVAGTEIRQFQAFHTAQDARDYEDRVSGVLDRVERLPKPTIALIRGYAVGSGFGLAAAADLRFCTPDARFGVPIARTLGNCPSSGNLARMLALLGPSRMKDMLFRARLIDAEEARLIGIVSEIVPAEDLEGRVREVAATIASNAPITIRVSKEAIRRLDEERRRVHVEDLILEAYMSEDFHEGVRAFIDKRRADFRGR